jgi:hypothetical protein
VAIEEFSDITQGRVHCDSDRFITFITVTSAQFSS